MRFLFILFLQAASFILPQSPLGKTHLQVIAMRGSGYKKMYDRGLPVLEYKKELTNDSTGGNYTTTELLYFEHDTCIKDIAILPATQADSMVNYFNLRFKPSGYHSWIGADGSFISISVRDNLLDITSFSAVYYKKLSGH